MPDIEPLCDYCSRIDLEPKLDTYDVPEWSLGPGSRIKTSRCPICILVKHVLHEVERIELDMSRPALSERKQVTLSWFGNGRLGNRGAFSVSSSGDHSICFAGEPDFKSRIYYLQPHIPSELDISRVDRWLSVCAGKHSVNCNTGGPMTFEKAFPGLRLLRLIDVERSRLVQTMSICQYAALSYVWGTVPNFRLTKENKDVLMAPDGIEQIWGMLPRTIRDAILLTRKLRLRYLWVDALCLIQNDPKDFELGVAVMDQVFERSWLTIIAACGHDANAGLPGVREGSRKVSHLLTEVKKGVSLGVYTRLDQLFKYSVYNSRAWTYVPIF
jgi:hypothetical protein